MQSQKKNKPGKLASKRRTRARNRDDRQLHQNNRTCRSLPGASWLCPPSIADVVPERKISLEVEARQDNSDENWGLVAQKKAIMDLYPIIKKHRRKIGPEPDWKPDAQLWEILKWIADMFAKIAPKHEAQGLKKKNGEYIPYAVHEYCPDYEINIMTLEFLPSLEEKDKRLHDIVLMTIGLVIKLCGIGGIMNYGHIFDYYTEMELPELREETENYSDRIAAIEEVILYYTIEGPPKKYHDRITAIGESCSVDDLEYRLEDYRVGGNPGIIAWIEDGLYLCRNGHLDAFFDEAYYDDREILYPNGSIMFVWSDNDMFWDEIERELESHHNSGFEVALLFHEIDLNCITPEDPPDWPYRLFGFFYDGYDLFCRSEKEKEEDDNDIRLCA